MGGYRNIEREREAAKKRWSIRMSIINEVKDSSGCVICGYRRVLPALHFHHINPSEKSHCIAEKLGAATVGDLLKEISKCVVLCANCHAEVHNGLHPDYLIEEPCGEVVDEGPRQMEFDFGG